ncbi:caspase b-like isoform X1 [Garra rufa]|uniref:caspase b-like isoform X1 n=1 Tax=Garra rufa TaxID=137080 RepID=UPI003CCEA46D
METKRVMTETLEDLVDKELKQFIWQLSNGVKPGTAPIPRAKLQTSDREDVVDCMVKQYPDDAGEIAVQALRNMKQNELGQRLELKLKEVQQPVQEERRNDDESMELQPIQSDWYRPYSITACSQLFKHKLLTEEKNDVYLPTRTSHRKGSALLINNIKCDYITDRKGAEIDQANMEWLLTALGYSVEKHTNLSGNALNTAVKNFSKRYEHQNSDSTFVVIMSHGKRFDNKDAILGVHYNDRMNPSDIFFVEDIFSHLNTVSCPALIDKPKVILIQACRGGNTGGVYVPDSAFESDSWVHKEKDFVCFMSSLPDVSAYRDPENGSFFINYIVDTFSTSAHKYDIMELFRKIASRMEKDQRFRNKQKLLPCIERTTLVKKFYLFPGL